MKIEIKTCVQVSGNDGCLDFVTVLITETDLCELAKSKALERVDFLLFDIAECDEIDEVKIIN